MTSVLAPTDADIRDLEVLVRAHHPLIVLEADELDRAQALVDWVADKVGLPLVSWDGQNGLRRADMPGFEAPGTEKPAACLDYVLSAHSHALYFLPHFERALEDDGVVQRLHTAAHKLFQTPSALILPGAGIELPPSLQRIQTTINLSAPTPQQYFEFVQQLLRDLQRRMPIRVKLSREEVSHLLNQIQGLSLFEVKKILTKLVVESGSFHGKDVAKVAEAKRDIISRSGVLEYFASEETMGEVAGLDVLKNWLGQRKVAFERPEEARSFGLSAPKGLLLLGVAGCGKSLCAKAVASEWQLPLIRLDPSNLYSKYFGESEKNLRRAIRTAESLSPIVLWIDEIEKALAPGRDDDSGTSTRILGTFLTWLQDKKEGVFVIATANDIEKLPPELLRKGRFDEIFFVDLPTTEVRSAILSVHLRRRGRKPEEFDLADLAQLTEGFSGSEIEQVVLSSLYTAFSRQIPLSTELLREEIDATVPLSVTACEKVAALRTWARDRAVFAG